MQQHDVVVTALTPSAEERLPALTVVGVGRARGGHGFESVNYACCARQYGDQPSQKVLQSSAGREPRFFGLCLWLKWNEPKCR